MDGIEEISNFFMAQRKPSKFLVVQEEFTLRAKAAFSRKENALKGES